MAALALAVGAYLVQTRLPNAECLAQIDSTLGVGASHRFKNLLKRPCAPLASKRCAEVVKHQGALCFWRRGLYQTPCFRAGLRQEDPPNLNIFLSGGKKLTRIPSVTASEAGSAQCENLRPSGVELWSGFGFLTGTACNSLLRQRAGEGHSPVPCGRPHQEPFP